MTSSTIFTCILGLLFLLPLAASFWMMAFRIHDTAAKLQASVDDALTRLKAEIDSEVTPDFPGAMAGKVEVTQQLHLPLVAQHVWSLYPRRWVGFLGFACTTIIAILWIFSSFSPALRLSAEYGRAGWPPDSSFPPASPKDSSSTIYR